jgi:hypothetical protein
MLHFLNPQSRSFFRISGYRSGTFFSGNLSRNSRYLLMIRMTLFICLLLTATSCWCQRLEHFAAFDAQGRKIGYTHIRNYYGFIESDSRPDTVIQGKEVYFLYFHLNDTLPDLGLRIVNPVPALCMPSTGDAVSDNYYAHEQDKSGRFNTWMALEREDAPSEWRQIEFNDDGKEAPEATNSIIRIDDKKNYRLVPGNYRVVITSSKKEKLAGGFLVQSGSYGNIKSMNFSRDQSGQQ